MELKIGAQVKGTRILALQAANKYRLVCDVLVRLAHDAGAEEIVLPIIEPVRLYAERAGPEIEPHMYTFPDITSAADKPGNRMLCLRPEGTATCQAIADTVWKNRRDINVFYVTRCWRFERPQVGRYREFTQFGVEMLNPRRKPADQADWMMDLASRMIAAFTDKYEVVSPMRRAKSYYEGDGFEIDCPQLGGQKQVCGGGPYKQGYGFAIGVDRVMLLSNGW